MPWNKTPANEAVIAAKAPAQWFVLMPLRSQKFSPDASNLCVDWGKAERDWRRNLALRMSAFAKNACAICL